MAVFLLKESLEAVLPAAGIRPSAGSSAVRTMRAACTAQAPECGQSIQAIALRNVAVLRTDASGAGTFAPMQPGTYYLVGLAEVQGQPAIWHLRVDLKPGANPVRLSLSTAVPR